MRQECVASFVSRTRLRGEFDLRQHHDVGQLVPSPTSIPRRYPVAEPRANRDRRAKAEELRFRLHCVDHFGINTSIALLRDTVKSCISLSTLRRVGRQRTRDFAPVAGLLPLAFDILAVYTAAALSAFNSANVRPSPSSVASLPLRDCHLAITTSTYLGSSSIP
jgi:hypothetical protein